MCGGTALRDDADTAAFGWRLDRRGPDPGPVNKIDEPEAIGAEQADVVHGRRSTHPFLRRGAGGAGFGKAGRENHGRAPACGSEASERIGYRCSGGHDESEGDRLADGCAGGRGLLPVRHGATRIDQMDLASKSATRQVVKRN